MPGGVTDRRVRDPRRACAVLPGAEGVRPRASVLSAARSAEGGARPAQTGREFSALPSALRRRRCSASQAASAVSERRVRVPAVPVADRGRAVRCLRRISAACCGGQTWDRGLRSKRLSRVSFGCRMAGLCTGKDPGRGGDGDRAEGHRWRSMGAVDAGRRRCGEPNAVPV